MQPNYEDLVGRLADAIRGLAVPRAEEALISSYDGSHATSSLLPYSHLQRSTPASISHFKPAIASFKIILTHFQGQEYSLFFQDIAIYGKFHGICLPYPPKQGFFNIWEFPVTITLQDGENLPPLGRITGSASIETLVRVGLEKEQGLSADSRMVVLHDFTPCVDDELAVKRGQLVNVLYQENDWVYVIADDNREGFIPHSYCAPSKKLPSTRNGEGSGGDSSVAQSEDGASTTGSNGAGDSKNVPDIHPFFKDPSGVKYIVLYTFIARDENDVSVERGEFVTVLNREDPDWLWILRSDGQEGFVPSGFVCPANVLEVEPCYNNLLYNSNMSIQSNLTQRNVTN
ncbi:hypothetical protein LAZ67_14001797 [Cordylochernes scorpioides]|uniref:SH3 domain-containing protein n=1 Tax=Cordylochernes scorpioides TaxID=51811 RepID=A0ABY6L6A7_9ARAC|nr:hypothetical protein LAZ67_14001797 [Cordylochernes scorpioides]